MLRYIFYAALTLFFCGIANIYTIAQNNKTLSTVVIDPGHGGKDPGALGKKAQEKDIVLDVALRFGKLINDSIPSVKTIYTRDKDVFIPLDERAIIANKNKADLFISIHANASVNKAIYGAETYVLGLHRSQDNLEVAQKENSVITMEDDYSNKYEGFDPNDPESYIIFSLLQNRYQDQSIQMAIQMQSAFAEQGREDKGVRQAGFLVLRQTSMPSVLAELGYLSNAEEEKYLNSEEGRAQLALSLYNSFRKYKEQYDGSNSVSVKIEKNKPEPENYNKGVCYRIQVATVSDPKRAKVSDKFGPVEIIKEDNKHKVTIGHVRTYDEAQELLKKVKTKYEDAFIIAFCDGEKTSVRQAKKKESKK
ncbi:MAG: N-acetylmuramoyl-L-alanine amidase [Bacteroidales bacterium]|nr:N-acetylmuramoyl-L-alanine amidase [Bacteroidales bacterium]